MAEETKIKKYLDYVGTEKLVENIKEYVDNAVDSKADTDHNHDEKYYLKTEIDNMEFITTDDIDSICGTTIQIATASEVKF